jgi:rhodanese-related sulfurtransferase
MKSTPLRAALVALLVIAPRLAHPEGDLSTVPRISLADFKTQHDQDKLLVIDTRSVEWYRGGHIPGAISVPLSAWAEHLPRLRATRKPIVAYCA